jgi:class 3 adenylate cyclase
MKTFPWKEFLQRHPILATVRDDKRLDALLGVEVSWERTFAKDEVVVRKGELTNSVFIMGSGSAEVVGELRDGSSVSLAMFRRGDVFGEIALLTGRARMGTVRAVEPCTVLEVRGADFEQLMADYPDIEARLLLQASERLRGSEWASPMRRIEERLKIFTEIGEEEASFDRILATVLFTDIVDSTKRAAELGDRRWREVVQRYHATVRRLLARYQGTEIDTAGDGFFVTFDGPARAVRCAMAITTAVRALGIEVRAGLHTGEVERIGEKIGGLAVNIGARVAALAAPSEVLVSQTVRDLMVGSDLTFDDRGSHELKGVPGVWGLYTARNESAAGGSQVVVRSTS